MPSLMGSRSVSGYAVLRQLDLALVNTRRFILG